MQDETLGVNTRGQTPVTVWISVLYTGSVSSLSFHSPAGRSIIQKEQESMGG